MTGMGGGALVERSADPDRVRVALDLWSGDRPDLLEILDSDGALAARVVAVLAASRSLAGSTRVVLTTTTSPGPMSDGRSCTCRCSGADPAPVSTRSRAASRGSTGVCAMAAGGRS